MLTALYHTPLQIAILGVRILYPAGVKAGLQKKLDIVFSVW